MTARIYTCNYHAAVYDHLVSSGLRGLAVTHLDAHCDLKGSLVDPQAGRAWLFDPDLHLSTSTFLSLLAAQGIVQDIRWVHDEVGGRANDLGTVLLTQDLRRFPYNLRRRPAGEGHVLSYAEADFSTWRHREPERILDIDWDFFADLRKDPERINREIEWFLTDKIDVVPEITFVAYSPFYSVSDRPAYERFVARLAERFSAQVEALPESPEVQRRTLARRIPLPLRRWLRRQAVALKQRALGPA